MKTTAAESFFNKVEMFKNIFLCRTPLVASSEHKIKKRLVKEI